VADAERDHLMHQAPVAMAIMSGPRHVFTLANPLYCHILGRTEEALLGKPTARPFPSWLPPGRSAGWTTPTAPTCATPAPTRSCG